MYSIQNIGVILSALGCIFLLSFDTSGRGALFWIAVAGTICTACASSVGATGATISVEREWTKQLYTGDHQGLARMNAGMKRIDLICLILSPVALGLIMSTAGSTVAILSMGFWNILFWPLECILLDKARNESPILRTMANHMAKPQDTAQENEADSSAGLLDLTSGFGLYFKQDVFPAAFSLALIYLTVMSFGTIMTGYLAWSGVAEIELSLFRGYVGLFDPSLDWLVHIHLHKLPTAQVKFRTCFDFYCTWMVCMQIRCLKWCFSDICVSIYV